MKSKWIVKQIDENVVKTLMEAGASAVLAKILAARGITTKEDMDDFLTPKLQDMHDPYLMADMTKAVERIAKAIDTKESIWIYGDYDVDGVTSTSLLSQCLKFLGARISFYIPHRLKEGYGLNLEALDYIKKEGANLIITVDSGIRAFKSAKYSQELGIDLVITDHHEIEDGKIPDAYAVINPKDERGSYPFKSIAGVGVAFKLAWALCQKYSPGLTGNKVRPDLRKFLLDAMSYVAVGTVADVVPLVKENRIMARYGLMALEHSNNCGLRALKDVSGLKPNTRITSEDIGFRIAPRINAMGRLEHAKVNVELLTTQDAQKAREIARTLESGNQKRKKIQKQILKDALLQIEQKGYEEDFAIVIAEEGWHFGVVGIVASQLSEKFYRPVCVISIENGIGRASARSIAGFNLFESLSACKKHLLNFGGHAMAAGFQLKAENLDTFREKFKKIAEEALIAEELFPTLKVDAEVNIEEISWDFMHKTKELAPYGEKNPSPILLSKNLQIITNPPPERKGMKGEHLAFHVRQGNHTIKAIAFRKGELKEQMMQKKQCSMVFTPTINTWKQESIQLNVKDIRF